MEGNRPDLFTFTLEGKLGDLLEVLPDNRPTESSPAGFGNIVVSYEEDEKWQIMPQIRKEKSNEDSL